MSDELNCELSMAVDAHMEGYEHEEIYDDSSRCEVADLYDKACTIVAEHLAENAEILDFIPLHVVNDIYKKAYDLQLIDNLQRQLSNLKFFEKVLNYRYSWNTLHKCLHLVLSKEKDFAFFIASQKVAELQRLKELYQQDHALYKQMILNFYKEAVCLAQFLCDGGLYESACMVYEACDVSDLNGNVDLQQMEQVFDVSVRIARVHTLNCRFEDAKRRISQASMLLSYLQNKNIKVNYALFYSVWSMYLFTQSNYDKAHDLAQQAVLEINRGLSQEVIIETLRQACKTCIIKRSFNKAHMYIKAALCLAKHWFGEKHSKFGDCVSDYGFYLLNVDMVSNSVVFYTMALKIREELFGEANVVTAVTHEDLAYALYVRDYSHGDFEEARQHSESALKILAQCLPDNHLLLASSKRVQALILEELALDCLNHASEIRLLKEAEKLHLESLKLARQSFGEDNVQTAKHYGNLGRLYQSMKKFKEAEKNHITAIEIKERLLGKEDYEVALSIGHLASLYNFDMKKYKAAEDLYRKSIAIGCKLFGIFYSGLEYDYRGLIYLYEKTGQFGEMSKYQTLLSDWELERSNMSNTPNDVIMTNENDDITVDAILSTVSNASKSCGLTNTSCSQ